MDSTATVAVARSDLAEMLRLVVHEALAAQAAQGTDGHGSFARRVLDAYWGELDPRSRDMILATVERHALDHRWRELVTLLRGR